MKYLIYSYIFILCLLAIFSLILTWANDENIILELYVDFIFIAGSILYTLKKPFSFWWVLFFLALIGEFFILKNEGDYVFWMFILAPAIFFNIQLVRLGKN